MKLFENYNSAVGKSMREEKEMAEVVFLLAANFLCVPSAIKADQNTSSTKRNISTIETQKYP